MENFYVMKPNDLKQYYGYRGADGGMHYEIPTAAGDKPVYNAWGRTPGVEYDDSVWGDVRKDLEKQGYDLNKAWELQTDGDWGTTEQ